MVDERETAMRAKLEQGWEWLKEHGETKKGPEFFDRWLNLLAEYTQTYDISPVHSQTTMMGGDTLES